MSPARGLDSQEIAALVFLVFRMTFDPTELRGLALEQIQQFFP
jgi:hypothetical protein